MALSLRHAGVFTRLTGNWLDTPNLSIDDTDYIGLANWPALVEHPA
jgi:hypothetical protein